MMNFAHKRVDSHNRKSYRIECKLKRKCNEILKGINKNQEVLCKIKDGSARDHLEVLFCQTNTIA